MKKLKICLIMSVFVAAGCYVLTGCRKADADTNKNKEPNTNGSTAELVISIADGENSNIVQAPSSIQGNEGESNVLNKINYPSFNDIKNADKVNKIIFDYVSEFNNFYGPEYGMEFKLEYKVMFKNDKYISIYFFGEISNTSHPEPSIFKTTLNIDINSASKMKLSDFADVNDELVNKVNNILESHLTALGVKENRYTNDVIKSLLDDTDNNEGYIADMQSYFINNTITIILNTPYALGEYVEISIPDSFNRQE